MSIVLNWDLTPGLRVWSSFIAGRNQALRENKGVQRQAQYLQDQQTANQIGQGIGAAFLTPAQAYYDRSLSNFRTQQADASMLFRQYGVTPTQLEQIGTQRYQSAAPEVQTQLAQSLGLEPAAVPGLAGVQQKQFARAIGLQTLQQREQEQAVAARQLAQVAQQDEQFYQAVQSGQLTAPPAVQTRLDALNTERARALQGIDPTSEANLQRLNAINFTFEQRARAVMKTAPRSAFRPPPPMTIDAMAQAGQIKMGPGYIITNGRNGPQVHRVDTQDENGPPPIVDPQTRDANFDRTTKTDEDGNTWAYTPKSGWKLEAKSPGFDDNTFLRAVQMVEEMDPDGRMGADEKMQRALRIVESYDTVRETILRRRAARHAPAPPVQAGSEMNEAVMQMLQGTTPPTAAQVAELARAAAQGPQAQSPQTQQPQPPAPPASAQMDPVQELQQIAAAVHGGRLQMTAQVRARVAELRAMIAQRGQRAQ